MSTHRSAPSSTSSSHHGVAPGSATETAGTSSQVHQVAIPQGTREQSLSRSPCRKRGRSTEGGPGSLKINKKLLIQLVKDQPALWDPTYHQYGNHKANERLWEDIASIVINCWEGLSPEEQVEAVKNVKSRWHFIRVRYELEEEEPFRYADKLKFLEPYINSYTSSSSMSSPMTSRSQSPVSIPPTTDNPTAGPSNSAHTDGQEPTAPLPATSHSVDCLREKIVSSFQAFLDRTGRKHSRDYDDLARIIQDSLMRFDEQICQFREQQLKLRDEVHTNIQRLERAGSLGTPMTNSLRFLQSLVPYMEQMSPVNMYECKIAMKNTPDSFSSF